jgi:hypothetical protein
MPVFWTKPGRPAQPLPTRDVDDAGSVWTDLADSAEARAACGWTEADVPHQVAMVQARLALRDAGLLAAVDAFVAGQTEEVRIAWGTSAVVRRDAPLLAAAAGAMGLTTDQLDALFFAAAAVPLPTSEGA